MDASDPNTVTCHGSDTDYDFSAFSYSCYGSGAPLPWTTRTWTSGPGSFEGPQAAALNSAIARATQVSDVSSGTDAARCAGRR